MAKLNEYVSSIDNQLEKIAKTNDELGLGVKIALTSKGKRIRAILALLMCKIYSGDPTRAMPISVIYELAHIASLTQDDIMDQSDTRHSKPSIFSIFGAHNAILTSDVLIFEIFTQFSEFVKWLKDLDQLQQILKLLGDSAKAAAKGQRLQMVLNQNKINTSQEEYLEVVENKTGSLMAASCASGAIIGGAPSKAVQTAYSFGSKFGTAYQIIDDAQDVLGSPKKLGKPIFQDLSNKNSNILFIHGMKNASRSDRKYLVDLNKENLSEEDVKKVQQIFYKTKSIEHALKLASSLLSECRIMLLNLKPCEARRSLNKLTYLIGNKILEETQLFSKKSNLIINVKNLSQDLNKMGNKDDMSLPL